MSTMNIIACLGNIGTGLLLIALSIPLLQRSARRNRLYGFRFASSFQSDENWQRINTYGARWMIIWSVLIIILGIGAIFVPLNNLTLAIIWAALPAAIIPTIVITQTYIYAQRR